MALFVLLNCQKQWNGTTSYTRNSDILVFVDCICKISSGLRSATGYEHYMVSMVQEGNGGSTYPAWPCTGIPLLISIFDISRLYFHITTVLGDKPTLLMLNGGRITYKWIYILHNAVPTLLYHSSSPLPTMINHGETTQVHTDTSDNYSARLNILSSFRRKLIQDLIRKQK